VYARHSACERESWGDVCRYVVQIQHRSSPLAAVPQKTRRVKVHSGHWEIRGPLSLGYYSLNGMFGTFAGRTQVVGETAARYAAGKHGV
jgi:hypothetical protein